MTPADRLRRPLHYLRGAADRAVPQRAETTTATEPTTHLADALAQDIRRIDGDHSMGAGALGEALVMAGWTLPYPTETTTDPADLHDGHHSMAELYEYRLLYNAHAAHGWHAAGIPVVKSWRHSDGEECFGGGWFIVTATLPAGQVSNHYEAKHWGLFKVPEVDLPPEWDGHTPADAAARLRIEAEHTAPATDTPEEKRWTT